MEKAMILLVYQNAIAGELCALFKEYFKKTSDVCLASY